MTILGIDPGRASGIIGPEPTPSQRAYQQLAREARERMSVRRPDAIVRPQTIRRPLFQRQAVVTNDVPPEPVGTPDGEIQAPRPVHRRRERSSLLTAFNKSQAEFSHCLIGRVRWKGPVWAMIAREVAAKHGVSFRELVSNRRGHEVVVARHEAFYRCKEETLMTLPQIGRHFGRDHTTVLYGIRKHMERMATGAAS